MAVTIPTPEVRGSGTVESFDGFLIKQIELTFENTGVVDDVPETEAVIFITYAIGERVEEGGEYFLLEKATKTLVVNGTAAVVGAVSGATPLTETTYNAVVAALEACISSLD